MDKLVAKRWLLRLTAREVARRIGVSPSALCKWERGQKKPTDAHMRAWKRALK